ncbi:MAG TPA: peptidoglycan editing factor PgeF [Rhizomicrobium sp.]
MLRFAATNLGGLTGIAHAFFGRERGVSTGIYASLNCGPGSRDDRNRVIENRRCALEAFAPPRSHLVTLHQVHGAEAVTVREPWQIGEQPLADAMATGVTGIALGILTADCAPILLADTEARVVGAAHAGWKGALAGVIESAVVMMEKLGARRGRIAAAIGPSISQPSYEVGADLCAQVLADRSDNDRFFAPSNRSGHWRFDLAAYAHARLERAGVLEIADLGLCTYTQDAVFYSYRRATHCGENDYGRQLSAIMLI